jgi:hypothetical protein
MDSKLLQLKIKELKYSIATRFYMSCTSEDTPEDFEKYFSQGLELCRELIDLLDTTSSPSNRDIDTDIYDIFEYPLPEGCVIPEGYALLNHGDIIKKDDLLWDSNCLYSKIESWQSPPEDIVGDMYMIPNDSLWYHDPIVRKIPKQEEPSTNVNYPLQGYTDPTEAQLYAIRE